MADPVGVFQYALDIGGKVSGYFQDCAGLGSESEVIEQKTVDANGREVVRKVPGRLRWLDVRLKRGLTTALDIWQWRQQVADGAIAQARKNCTITMMDGSGKPIAQWQLSNAWPLRVSGPQVESSPNSFGIEELVLVHEGLTRVK